MWGDSDLSQKYKKVRESPYNNTRMLPLKIEYFNIEMEWKSDELVSKGRRLVMEVLPKWELIDFEPDIK